MDFNLTAEQADIQKAANEFARGEFDPDLALQYDRDQEFPTRIWKKASQLGFLGVHYPVDFGGQGLGLLENALIAEAFCGQDSGIGMALAVSDFGSEIVLHQGNEDQKRKVLPLVSQGKGLMTLAFLEEGYSLASFKTVARADNTGYVIDGSKSFVTLGSQAHYIVVVCQTMPDDPFAQSVFIIEKGMAGVDASTMGEKLGMRMIPMSQVSFHHVRVPRDGMVGEWNRGHSQLKGFLDVVRIEAGAIGVGIAQGALDRSLEYSRKREQFGKPIATFDPVRNKLADMCADVEMARLVVHKAAWSVDQGRPDARAILLSKMIASKTAYGVTNDALQIHGGLGYMTEAQVEHFYRDARVLDLFVEQGQIEKNLLADLITGRTSIL